MADAQATVENLIAHHVADNFPLASREFVAHSVSKQIRNSITHRFRRDALQTEQDNTPSGFAELGNRLAAAFLIERETQTPQERSHKLADLRSRLEKLRIRAASDPAQRNELEHVKTRFILQREQLLMRNEFSEGIGRIEIWLLSIAACAIALLSNLSLFWATPVLAFSIGRSWYLDRRFKQRQQRIAEIDEIIRVM
jgi:hypothetical protein